tara:strand:- start:432 stop:821 length:390 start_codon:yes stop_codon:yes gene_type:complete
MILTSLAGIQSITYPYELRKGMKLEVTHESDNPYQEHGKAYQVKHENFRIGYLPLLNTIYKRMIESKQRGDHQDYEYNLDKYNSAEMIRDEVTTDLFRNHLPHVDAEIFSVKYTEEGEVLSIVVQFNYM